MNHQMIQSLLTRAREAADKRVLCIDGTYKGLMNVLYQVPHGGRKVAPTVSSKSELHVILSVLCPDSVLTVFPAPSEHWQYQLKALQESTGPEGCKDVLAIFSDTPTVIDIKELRRLYPNLKCIAKDLLHIALKVEQANSERPNEFSRSIRRCLLKFRNGGFVNEGYYRQGDLSNQTVQAEATLDAKIARMLPATADLVYNKIWSKRYHARKYDQIGDFTNDLAVICKKFPAFCAKRIPGTKTTVIGSLRHATKPHELKYIMNFAIFIARNPGIEVPYGTTSNEAFHKQVKGFFRNVQIQTARNAVNVCSVIRLAKLISGWMNKTDTVENLREHETLKKFVNIIMNTCPVKFDPKLNFKVVANDRVDKSVLPPNAKVCRVRHNKNM